MRVYSAMSHVLTTYLVSVKGRTAILNIQNTTERKVSISFLKKKKNNNKSVFHYCAIISNIWLDMEDISGYISSDAFYLLIH